MKTRAFDPETKQWRTDYVVMPKGKVYATINQTHRFPWKLYDPDIYAVEVDWKLSRFTGLLDKNKNEIYENHILKLASGSIGVVEFRDGSFVVDIKKDSGEFELYEWPSDYFMEYDYDSGYVPGTLVIGDVFLNPELLEV